MKICLIEPYLTGSHAAWAEEYARFSRHQVELLTLPGRHWKWRMHGGAVTLARRFLAQQTDCDLLLASDMLDLAVFLALTRSRTARLPSALFLHENQLTFPWSPDDNDPRLQRDAHYAFINFTAALAADAVLFNSVYHRTAFFEELPGFLGGFPDQRELASRPALEQKSRVLALGLDLARLDQHRIERDTRQRPLLLWNHRWEYDKNPQEFFDLLFRLQQEGFDFEVAVLGEAFRSVPAVFEQARRRLGERVVRFGFVDSFADYARWLWRADLLPVTSQHDFFGASVVQAIYCGCQPLLPDRLAYPEHLPEELRASCLYHDSDELLACLRQALSGRAEPPAALRHHVSRYDWSRQAPAYDELFDELAEAAA
jgi:glycosyltransferase involved in cell wall biosynthesis